MSTILIKHQAKLCLLFIHLVFINEKGKVNVLFFFSRFVSKVIAGRSANIVFVFFLLHYYSVSQLNRYHKHTTHTLTHIQAHKYSKNRLEEDLWYRTIIQLMAFGEINLSLESVCGTKLKETNQQFGNLGKYKFLCKPYSYFQVFSM